MNSTKDAQIQFILCQTSILSHDRNYSKYFLELLDRVLGKILGNKNDYQNIRRYDCDDPNNDINKLISNLRCSLQQCSDAKLNEIIEVIIIFKKGKL